MSRNPRYRAVAISIVSALSLVVACGTSSDDNGQRVERGSGTSPATKSSASSRIKPSPRISSNPFQPVILNAGRLGQMPQGDILGIQGQLIVSNGITSTDAVYDVRNYGAKCDGSTDDTTAFNTALTAMYNARWRYAYGTSPDMLLS